MSNVVKIPNRDAIEEQACLWVAKLDAGSLSDDDTHALDNWLNEDPSHSKVLIEMAELLDNMTVLSQLSELFPLESLSTSAETKENSSKSFAIPFAKAGALATAIVLLAVFIDVQKAVVPTPQALTVNTIIGEYRTVSLADDSQVTLNTYSQINVNFTENERNVKLARGEAHFNVESNKERPFIVTVADTTVTAIGTAFNVKTTATGVEVTVIEGLVEITSSQKKNGDVRVNELSQGDIASPATQVAGGQIAIINEEAKTLRSIDPKSIEKKLAWQNGMVVFEGETLEQVVEEISRYTDTQFIITEPEARSIRVGGYFEIGDIDKMLDIFEHGFKIVARKSDTGVIYLSRLDIEKNQN